MSQPQPPNTPLLQIDDLVKVFNIRQGFASKKFHAVDGATLSLENDKPEIFTIAGESGSGKTTLARMILGMEHPTTGVLKYKGRSIAELSSQEKSPAQLTNAKCRAHATAGYFQTPPAHCRAVRVPGR